MVTHSQQPQPLHPLLAELARLYGVETGYRDSRGAWRDSPTASVVAVLVALGAALDIPGANGDPAAVRPPKTTQLELAIRERRLESWRRMVEPVIVAWDGVLPDITLRLPTARVAAPATRLSGADQGREAPGRGAPRSLCGRPGSRIFERELVEFTLELESGDATRWSVPLDSLRVVAAEPIGHKRFEALQVPRRTLPLRHDRDILSGFYQSAGARGSAGTGRPPGQRLPFGYHRLQVEAGGLTGEATVISAPRRCWSPGGGKIRSSGPAGRKWGVFTPLYGLAGERNWGAGDLADMAALCDWVAAEGGTAVATLPLLASYLDQPFEPAPYRPVSRMFWNEFYLAVDQIPEWERCPSAREIWSAPGFQERLRRVRALPLVDYREIMALKRRVLEEIVRDFFEEGEATRKEAFLAYVGDHPHLAEYAAFRARMETGAPGARSGLADPHALETAGAGLSGRVAARDWRAASAAERYHLFCQWQMEEQLASLSRRERRDGARLLLDLPLGVHPSGFDSWRWPELFVDTMSAGAPPDSFFTLGQTWESPPLHPDLVRLGGHRYHRRCIEHHMRHAEYLRVDHVMALHRLYWVPQGSHPADGVYVRYPADELYAVLCLESNRNGTVVVGEDLGTVPTGVRRSMRSHGMLGTWVLQGSLRPRSATPIPEVPFHRVASLNTHDMFPFAGFVRGDDIRSRVDTGQLGAAAATRELEAREKMVGRLATFLRGRSIAGDDVAEPGLPVDWDLNRKLGCDRRRTTQDSTASAPGATLPRGPGCSKDEDSLAELLVRALGYLAASEAELVVVNLEDLWLETRAQNVPGTKADWPNWRRKVSGSELGIRAALAAAGRVMRPNRPR